MRYFTWKLELVSNILWMTVDSSYHGFLKNASFCWFSLKRYYFHNKQTACFSNNSRKIQTATLSFIKRSYFFLLKISFLKTTNIHIVQKVWNPYMSSLVFIFFPNSPLLAKLFRPTSSPAHPFALRGRRKRGPGTLQARFQICPNRGHIFQNKLRGTWTALLKISALSRHLVRIFSM